jgi:hypothetical protein
VPNIQDVSPTLANTSFNSSFNFATGRMLSLASADDGRLVFAGSFSSNVWVSEDGGDSWAQIEWPQPAAGQFGVPGAMGGSCVTSLAVAPDSCRFRVERNPRLLADITGDRRADIVGFGDTGIWTARSNGDGTFAPPQVVLAAFGEMSGGWHIDKHPRFLADLRGNGRSDIVGFGDAGVYVALSNGDGTFGPVRFVLAAFGPDAGGWQVGKHPRFVVDITGNGRADIVGFGDAGVYVALGNGDGTFQPVQFVLADFGYDAGGWRVDQHPRFVVDITGDGRADIVGFGNAGVYVALGNGDGTFQPVRFVVADFGFDSGWRVDMHPRILADLRHKGRADIVGFGNAGVYVALSNGDGTFTYQPQPVLADFGYEAGGWRVDQHPRMLADVRGNGRADIVGFGNAGVYVAYGNGDGTFSYQPQPVVANFGLEAGGWRVDRHPRMLADLRGIGRADIVGFGDAGVYVALSNRDGAFAETRFVLPNFGYEVTVLALVRDDREALDAGIWRSSDRGRTWSPVHPFPRRNDSTLLGSAGEIEWAPGTANFVYTAGGSALAVSRDGGATFQDVMPMTGGGFQAINHVAVAATPSGALAPPVVYALVNQQMFVSFDAGVTWIKDLGTLPARVGGAVGLFNAPAAKTLVVSPRSPLEVFVTANEVNADTESPGVFRGDFLQFLGTKTSLWESVVLPNLGQQFSGMVFMEATQPRHGNVLFYSPQRAKTFVAPLDPTSAADWHALDDDQHVHQDLHGVYLSADFEATFEDGVYKHLQGTVWMTSDGGVHWSGDGGRTFQRGKNVNTLSCVNIAAVALQGHGPVISLNTGDNDGFTSSDGGAHWSRQQYGGGDNDCSYADPLRPHSMLILTPRWDTQGNSVPASLGNTVTLYDADPGHLPDVSVSTNMRHVVPGPPLRPRSTLWNASSGFALRGFRPIVLNLPGDDPQAPGDYVFIRYFGNTIVDNVRIPNNLAILLRTRRLRDITKRGDWETPGSWRVDRHPRLLGDLTGSGRADIVGFGDDGVWTALSKPNGTFADPQFVLADFGYAAGGWRVEQHPRFLADLTGTGRHDIVGFGNAGVYVALSNGDGTFQPVRFVVADFGAEAGGWNVAQHPRFLADITGDGRADIVGFGDAGVYVALGNGDGTFQPVRFVLADFGEQAGGWHVDQHPRFLADLTGTGSCDIVGFGNAGVYVALSNGDGTFQPVRFAVADFGAEAGGWHVDRHPRFVADITGDGRADIVGFGDGGVYVALGNGDGTFQPVRFVLADFGYEAGGWRVERHPRFLADVKAKGRADIVGFGNDGVYVAYSNGDGTFAFTPLPVVNDFGFDAGGWRIDQHVRTVADVTGDGRGEVVGFGDAGVMVARNNGDGTFQQPALFVIPNFGHGDGGFVEQQGPFLPAVDAGIVQASGGHAGTVFYVGGDSNNMLWKWTEGMPGWQQLVPGGTAGAARRFFVNPYVPSLVYVLDNDHVLRSDDGGANWQIDASLEQQLTCGGRIPANRGEDAGGIGDHLDTVLNDMQFDPFDAQRRFAVGIGGAFMTRDGVNWERLLDTGALRGRPSNAYFDWISQPSNPALYVSFAGRSIVKIDRL